MTVTPVSQGTATVSVSQTSNTTDGSFNLAPASFTVNVAPPANTAPAISVLGVTGGTNYDKGSVPAATCSVTDAEDGNTSFAATLSAVSGPYASDGIGSQTASCSYTDDGGLTAEASETYTIGDPSAPGISYVLSPAVPNGDNGWYRGDGAVTLEWTVTDSQSPNSLEKTGCVDQNITADQEATTYSCSATSAGGSAAEQTVSIKRDGTAPVVSYDSADGTPGANGWYTSAVTAQFSATDATSGLATTSPQTVISTTEGAAVSLSSPAFTDLAGNTTAAGVVAVRRSRSTARRRTHPQRRSPLHPTVLCWNKSDVVVSFAPAGDNGPSGVASCTADATVDTEGANQTVTGTCTDEAGNVSAETVGHGEPRQDRTHHLQHVHRRWHVWTTTAGTPPTST